MDAYDLSVKTERGDTGIKRFTIEATGALAEAELEILIPRLFKALDCTEGEDWDGDSREHIN